MNKKIALAFNEEVCAWLKGMGGVSFLGDGGVCGIGREVIDIGHSSNLLLYLLV